MQITGAPLYSKEPSYKIQWGSSVSACSASRLVVMEEGFKTLHIHSLVDLEEVMVASKEQLGLTEEEEINSIGCGPGEHVHVVSRKKDGRYPYKYTRMIAYKVCIVT